MSRENNNIEDRFKDIFNGDIQDEGWNSPSKSAWPPIDTKINEAVPPKGTLWPAIWLLTLLLGSFAVWHLYFEVQKTQKALQDVETLLKSCAEEKEMLGESSLLRSNMQQSVSTVVGITPTPSGRKAEEAAAITTAASVAEGQHPAMFDEVWSSGKQTDKSLDYLRAGIVKSILLENETASKNREAIASTDILAVKKLSVSGEYSVPSNLEEVPWPTSKNIEENGFYVSSLYSATKDIIRSSSFTEPGTVPIPSQSSDRGNSFGIMVSKQVSKHWYVSAGVSYIQQQYNTNYDLSLAYQHSDEEHHGDHGRLHFHHNLPSVVGDLSTDLILSRALTSSISESETVALDFDVSSSLQEIGIPLSLQYYTGKNRTGLHVGMVLQPLYIHTTSSAVSQVVSHHSSIFDSYAAASSEVSNINQLQLLTGLSAGYDYPISDYVRVGVSANFLYSLTAITDSPTYRVAADRLSFGLSLTNRF